jgi:hypothetical protein
MLHEPLGVSGPYRTRCDAGHARRQVQRARDSCQDVRAPHSQLGEQCHGDEEAVVSQEITVGRSGQPVVWRKKIRAQERRQEVGSAEIDSPQIVRAGLGPEVIGAQELSRSQALTEAIAGRARQARRDDGRKAGR